MKKCSRPENADAAESELYFYGKDEEIFEVTVFEPAIHQTALPESLIHAIWRNQQFDTTHLFTHTGERLQIHKTGRHNFDTGPDFIDASVTIEDTCWHGDVELHRSSKEWYLHKHHLNTRYNSTILHVTLFEDDDTGTLKREDGSLIPELVLSTLLKTHLRSLLYAHRTSTTGRLACADSLSTLQVPLLTSWLRQLGNTRLGRKKQRVEKAFLADPNLENILYRLIFTGLGYAKNCEPMLSLSQRIPLQTVRTLKESMDIEALYLGVSGLLPAVNDRAQLDDDTRAYLEEISQRFSLINEQLHIPCMAPHTWRFFRLRPSNFPPLRIAQAAALFKPECLLYADAPGALALAMDKSDPRRALSAIRRLFYCRPSSFWQTHYQFRNTVAPKSSIIGQLSIDRILINAIFPMMLVYAESRQDPAMENAIFDILALIRAEKDTVTNQFKALALNAGNAALSQGLHELYQNHCKKGMCLHCKIGMSILNKNLDPFS